MLFSYKMRVRNGTLFTLLNHLRQRRYIMSLITKTLTMLAVAALVLSSISNAVADDAHYKGWTRSFEEAKELAAKEGKSILMEFTGSDWCPPCKALHKNVLSQDAFQTVKEDYILLVLDNPRDKSLVTPAEQEQYKQLSGKFQVQGVPSIFLADAKGRPFHFQSGYGGQKAEQWVADIRAKKETLDKRNAAFEKAESATGVEKAKALDEAISIVDAKVAVAFYGDSVDQILELDADGLGEKYAAIKRAVEFEETLGTLTAKKLDADKLSSELDALIEKTKPAAEQGQMALFMRSQRLFGAGNKPAAKVLLLAAQKLDPESRVGQQIPQILENFFKD